MSVRNSQRPLSRASTASDTTQADESLAQSLQHDPRPGPNAFNSQGPEAALLQYHASMAPQPMVHFAQAPVHNNGHYISHGHPHGATNTVPAQQTPYDSPYLNDLQPQPDIGFVHMRVGSVPIPTPVDPQDERRRKGSAVTATNDKELREMLAKNEGRPLREVAQEVIQKERTPMAEKTKQLFAMLWLRAVCKPAKTSVPRNRVYSQYATRCGTERVVPLNPASFGKLVRVIFPGIQTRRLGVRGESKYHYVDLALEDEPQNPPPGSWSRRAHGSQGSHSHQIDFNNIPRLQADAASFHMDGSFDASPVFPPTPRGPASQSQTFVHPHSRGMQPGTAESLTYSRTLRFPSSSMPPFSESDPVDLPLIQPYLPPRTDADTADALAALYRTHCTSLIDSIRFCKEKQFFRLYASFHGTLTVPVQKLFTHPNLASWIEQCDLVMYRTMVRFVSRLTLQAAPPRVINTLSSISASLRDHIARVFATHPAHVIEAKQKPATIFAGLLYRLIRVNQAAHAAANLLTVDQNREQMWHEWANMVSIKRVLEAELPDCGYEEVYKIMTSEMRNLLEPLQAPNFADEASLYSFDQPSGDFAQFLQSQAAPVPRSGPSQVSTENVLDRWSAFLMSLPGRFPHAPARTVLHCISAVGTAALRDITIMSGLSYAHWWVLKIFVDEMALWMAEMGGFLEPSGSIGAAFASGNVDQSPVMDNGISRSQSNSRMSSMGPSANNNADQASRGFFLPGSSSGQQQHQRQSPPQQNFASQQHSQQQQQQQYLHLQSLNQSTSSKYSQQETDVDDSGIGMSLMDDDDMDLSKFASNHAAHLQGHMANGAVQPGMRVDSL